MPHKDPIARRTYARERARKLAPQRAEKRAAARELAARLAPVRDLSVKTCSRCKETKPIEMFGAKAKASDGRNWWCKACVCEGRKDYYARNAERARDYSKKYKLANKEMIKSKKSEWFQKNKEKIVAQKRDYLREYVRSNQEKLKSWRMAYYIENKEQIRIKSKEWQQNNKHKVNASIGKRRASKRNATPSWLTTTNKLQIEIIYAVAVKLTEITGICYSVDHIHPLQGNGFNGLHVPWNLRVVTTSDNSRKCNRLPLSEAHLAWNKD
jgi:hypothetical protein